MSKIALVRHGESEWNKIGLWTGWKDVPLTKDGKKEALLAARLLKDLVFHNLFTSDLSRAIDTLRIIKNELKLDKLPATSHKALKERNYGVYTGMHKWNIKKELGEIKFKNLRRGWNVPIEDGETLKDVFERVVPYYQKNIQPLLISGKNILLVAHGNSIRALVKYFEAISDEGIAEIEFETGEVLIYEIDGKGSMIKKERKKSEKN